MNEKRERRRRKKRRRGRRRRKKMRLLPLHRPWIRLWWFGIEN
jgi:hypothetical protein